MFLTEKNVLSQNLCDSLKTKFLELLKNSQHEKEVHFARAGRYCFENMDEGVFLLSQILKSLDSKVHLSNLYKNPVVQHTFLLAKMPGGVPTKLHQDRPYWGDMEDEPASMVTAWFSLQKIDETNGCLLINKQNKTNNLKNLNSKKIHLPHFSDSYTKSQGALTINSDIEGKLKPDLSPVYVETGDVVIFDAYEPHCAAANNTDYPRLAFKVVLGEKSKLKSFFKPVDELIK